MAETPFAFGKNWQRFLRCLTPERIARAEASIRDFTGLTDLRGKTFVDVGCGSGLFSLAAHNLGAARLVSLDVDPFSVQCCRHLHEQAGKPESWQVLDGSILDAAFVATLGTFDVVYSWGVLHHTGHMWDAITAASAMVNPQGLFYITIYNKVRGARGSNYWLAIKKFYNASPKPVRLAMEWGYIGYMAQSKLMRFKNPFNMARNYQAKRGMDWRTDITDWIGGYPYEFATVEEIFKGVRKLHPDFQLTNLSTTTGVGTNSFLFQRLAEFPLPS